MALGVATPEPYRQPQGQDDLAAMDPSLASSTTTPHQKRKTRRQTSRKASSRSSLSSYRLFSRCSGNGRWNKNRVAASKCRENKKRHVTQLQVDARVKQIDQASLVKQIMCMKEEV